MEGLREIDEEQLEEIRRELKEAGEKAKRQAESIERAKKNDLDPNMLIGS